MGESEIRAEIRSIQGSLDRIEGHVKKLEERVVELNLTLSTKVVRLETQMKIVMGVIGAGGLGAAGFFGLGG